MAYIFGSIWDRFNRNALNDLSKSVEYQGKSIQDLVAKGQLTPTQYAGLISIVNGLIKSGNVDKSDLTSEFKDEIEGFSAQLAQKANQAFVDSQFNSIVGGAPKETYTDLLALKTAYPNGTDGIFLTLDTGHWYYWNDSTSSWEDGGVYQASKISEKINEYDLDTNAKWRSVTTPWTIRIESNNIIPIQSRISIELMAGVGTGYIYLLEKVTDNNFVIKGVETFEGEYNKKIKIDTNLYALGNGKEYVAVVHERLSTSVFSYVPDDENQTIYEFAGDETSLDVGTSIETTLSTDSKIRMRFNIILNDIKYLDRIKSLSEGVSTLSNQVSNASIGNLYGRKWNAMGDSITAGLDATTNYAKIIADRNDMILRNYGSSGTSIAVAPDGTHQNAMVNRVESMDVDSDIVTVFGGTNDFGYQRPLGVFEDRVDNTFYGAVHLMLSKILTTYSHAKIAFIIPTPRTEPNNSIKFKQYLDILREVLEYYSVPYLDLNKEVGFTPHNTNSMTLMMPDGLHPSDTGHEMIADKVEAFLNGL